MAQKNNIQLKRSQLSKVAAELNDVLGLEPAINPKAKINELKEKVMEAGGTIDPEADELSEDTWKIMEVLGAAHRPAQEYVPDRSSEEATQTEPPSGEETQENNEQESSSDEEKFEPQTTEPNEQQQTEPEKAIPKNEKDNESKSGTSSKKAEEPRQQEATSNSDKSSPASKSKRFADDQVITVLAEENPKRNGSKCCDRFNLYKNGITVKQYVEAGGKRDDVRWDSERGYIQVQ